MGMATVVAWTPRTPASCTTVPFAARTVRPASMQESTKGKIKEREEREERQVGCKRVQ